ncbi:hypothetical protein E2C01_029206 [Portunus trituberculatus]|uniref:Uncharacterized protein n=1 Tax=Portunus trituberculatus TaxID=210409 RepID=A0A5B7EMF3_PORTR|nr:hypothetical protein [Portunus trituberculatus]
MVDVRNDTLARAKAATNMHEGSLVVESFNNTPRMSRNKHYTKSQKNLPQEPIRSSQVPSNTSDWRGKRYNTTGAASSLNKERLSTGSEAELK